MTPILYWCAVCGLTVEGDAEIEAPICRHGIGAKPGPRAERMVVAPRWHPEQPNPKHTPE